MLGLLARVRLATGNRDLQIRHSELAAHLQPGSAPLHGLLDRVHALMSLHAGSAGASGDSLALLAQMVQQQAAALSYSDVFRLLALLSFACVPAVFVLKRVKAGSRAVAH